MMLAEFIDDIVAAHFRRSTGRTLADKISEPRLTALQNWMKPDPMKVVIEGRPIRIKPGSVTLWTGLDEHE